jgi:3-oxoacyl-[acyl-carrier-protein] synthase II
MASSRLDPATVDPYRFGIHTGSGQTGLQSSQFFAALDVAESGDEAGTFRALGGRASRLVDRFWSLRTLSNAGLGLLAAEWAARGVCSNFVQGETASAQAIGAAFFDIAEGRSDAVLAGGYDSLLTASDYLAYEQEGLLSPAAPPRAYRPFDRARRGLVLGEGAAFLLLEGADSARKRGAVVLAEMLGAGFSQLRPNVGIADTEHAALHTAMSDALGGAIPEFLVARGIGTPVGDRSEADALTALGVRTPVTAIKGLTGYLGASTAAVEFCIAILAARERAVPPVAGLESPDEDNALDLVTGRARPLGSETTTFVAVSASWSGQCAALAARASAPGSSLR